MAPEAVTGKELDSRSDVLPMEAQRFRSLSMAPSSLGPIKAMVRSLRVGELSRYLKDLGTGSEHSLRENLRAFAIDHGVAI